MKRIWLSTGMAIAVFLAFTVGTMTHAEEGGKSLKAPEMEIVIDGKKPARFVHGPHLNLNIACGACHHDAKHEPLTQEAIASLPSADKLHCETCHVQGGPAEKFQKRMDIFHNLCKSCHQAGLDGKKGPTNCNGCHIKTKKKAIEGC